MIHFLSSLLVLYCWVVAAALIFFLLLIGRFYEIRFGQKSYYQLMILPLLFFVIAGAWNGFVGNRYTGNPLLDFVGDFWPDMLLLTGGFVLILLGYALIRMMMGGRR